MFRDMEDEAAFDYIKDSGVELLQFKQELIPAMLLMRNHLSNPKVVVEIGSGGGGNICMLSRMLAEDGLVVSIEPNGNRLNTEFVYECLGSIRFVHIPCRSDDPEAMLHLEVVLDYQKIDVLYIDGLHGYEFAKRDYEEYRGYMNEPGVVVFHDIAMGVWTNGERMVGLYWNETVKKEGYYAELRYDLGRPGFGTGIRFL